jgi:hypothetical protein
MLEMLVSHITEQHESYKPVVQKPTEPTKPTSFCTSLLMWVIGLRLPLLVFLTLTIVGKRAIALLSGRLCIGSF